MPKFLIEASYTLEGVKGLRSAGGTSRRDAIAHALESVGGTLEHFSFAFGVNSAGGATTKMTPLISPEEVDAAAKLSVEYRPPGS